MDAALLARAQFALTVAFHFVFPSITIGLAWLVATSEAIRARTGSEVWERKAAFWTRIFAVTFAVGVATGIVMEFQFGTNWSRYSTFVGDIFGAPLAAEGVLAFFLESTFLGILLFGRGRVSSRVRVASAFIVAFGATLSGFWIIVANSWMQTPAGYEIQGDKAVMTDFLAVVFNPSTMPRFLHTIASSVAAAAFLMTGISAFYVRRGRNLDVAARGLRMGLVVAVTASGLMFLTGDFSARQVAETQPEKFAAMQGVMDTTQGAPMIIFSLPPTSTGGDPMDGPAILVNRLLSFMAYGNWDATVLGVNAFPADQVPPVAPTFLSYHNMVAIGTLMLLLMASGAWLAWRRRIERSRNWLLFAVLAIPLPLIAIQLGWATAEIGRQPWIVYGLMRTVDGISPVVSASDIVLSLALLVAVYLLLGALWLSLLVRVIRRGPEPAPDGAPARGLEPDGPTSQVASRSAGTAA
jgi:cytochrome bd ubiquinol oxidase subunit I